MQLMNQYLKANKSNPLYLSVIFAGNQCEVNRMEPYYAVRMI